MNSEKDQEELNNDVYECGKQSENCVISEAMKRNIVIRDYVKEKDFDQLCNSGNSGVQLGSDLPTRKRCVQCIGIKFVKCLRPIEKVNIVHGGAWCQRGPKACGLGMLLLGCVLPLRRRDGSRVLDPQLMSTNAVMSAHVRFIA